MALFYLVRHGEPDYSTVREAGFRGFGVDFAPLTEKGVAQAENAAQDPRLKTARLIVSSPYPRALHTAQIISRATGLKVAVELDLREWIPDWENRYVTQEESVELQREFQAYRGEYPEGKKLRWETVSGMRTRMRRVAEKYADLDRVILVGHGMAFRTLTGIEKMDHAEIVEFAYSIGQPDISYF